MDKQTYSTEIQNFIEQFLDNRETVSNGVYQYNCILCGRSRANKPHMRIDYMNGIYYCYRCNQGGTLYQIIKEFKTPNNKEYVNNLLKIFFTVYEYDKNDKKIKAKNAYNAYEFTLDNIELQHVNNQKIDGSRLEFIKLRLPTLSDNDILKLVNKFKLSFPDGSNRFFYNSYHRKFAYAYTIQSDLDYRKDKYPNPNINNDKKDYYYLIQNYSASNLYISEGLFDLMTLDSVDPLYNSNQSNFLALCCRNYKYLYEVLLNSGKFYYDNIYLVLDNDINAENFINSVVATLSNCGITNKFKLYNNFYIIKPNKNYIDINDQYLSDNELRQLLIKKLR